MRSVARETTRAETQRPAGPVARETGDRGRRAGFPARLLIAPIRAYQRFISPLTAPRCRYYPSCSNYAIEALQELGPLRGSIVAAWRVLRCNPLNNGGLDPLSERHLFKGCADHPAHHQLPGGAR